MSEEISQGVRILVERCKTNPDEMSEEYGKWEHLRDAVFEHKESGARRGWLRGLTEKEIDLLYEAFSSLHRKIFDDYVMKQVLESDEGKEEKFPPAYLMAQGKRVAHGWNDPRLLAQNTIQPGSWVNTTTQTSNTSIATTLKNALGIK